MVRALGRLMLERWTSTPGITSRSCCQNSDLEACHPLGSPTAAPVLLHVPNSFTLPDRRDRSAGYTLSGERAGDHLDDSPANGSVQSRIYRRLLNRGAMTAALTHEQPACALAGGVALVKSLQLVKGGGMTLPPKLPGTSA